MEGGELSAKTHKAHVSKAAPRRFGDMLDGSYLRLETSARSYGIFRGRTCASMWVVCGRSIVKDSTLEGILWEWMVDGTPDDP